MVGVYNYQSNHFWNWNDAENFYLEGIFQPINRTTFGIETRVHRADQRSRFLLSIEPLLELKQLNCFKIISCSGYQSNHFWNWNHYAGEEIQSINLTINRTTFGIETQEGTQRYASAINLSIEPLLELKRSK